MIAQGATYEEHIIRHHRTTHHSVVPYAQSAGTIRLQMDVSPALQVIIKHVTHAWVQQKVAQIAGTREMQTRNLSNITSIQSKMST